MVAVDAKVCEGVNESMLVAKLKSGLSVGCVRKETVLDYY